MKPIFQDEILRHHIAFIGKTGAGKTSTAKLLVEQVVADGARVCILDSIKSDWWGLISSADGKKPGLPFHILGGPRGHVPLHSSAGKAIGELVGTGKLPLSIIDMADFEAGGLQRFFVDFAPALLKNIRGVLYLVIEESHEFAPKERSGMEKENMAVYYAKKLATAGRSKGLRIIVSTQRVQALHNALLGSCETMIVHRLTAPADQEPVKKWLKANTPKDVSEQVSASLSSLKTGTGWVCSGEAQVFEQVQFPRIKTYDNSAAPTDDRELLEVKTAPVNQAELRAILGDAVAEAEANDPKALKAMVAKLERELGIAEQNLEAKQPAKTETPEVSVLTDGDRDYLKDVINVLEHDNGILQDHHKNFKTVVDHLATHIEDRSSKIKELIDSLRKAVSGQDEEIRLIRKSTVEKFTQPVTSSKFPGDIRGAKLPESLPKGEVAVLTACIQFHRGVTREQLTVLTGYKRSSRDAYIQRLREKGLVDVSGDSIAATTYGIASMPNIAPLPTGQELQNYWLNRLPEGERIILSILIAGHPSSMQRSKFDELTCYKRSSRDAYLQRLAAKMLVTEPSRGEVRASDNLF